MKKVLVYLLLASASLPVMADKDFLFLPGIVTVFEYAEAPPEYEYAEAPPGFGLSLKGLLSMAGFMGPLVLNAFDLRLLYSQRLEQYRADLTWPGIFGILYPGISLDFHGGEVVPWFYIEVDFFVLTFFLIAMGGEPWVIPSPYVGTRIGAGGIDSELGIRLSFPIHEKKKGK